MSAGKHTPESEPTLSGPADIDAMTLADFVVRFPVQPRVRRVVLGAKARGAAGANLRIGELRPERPGQLQAGIPQMGSRTSTYLERRILEVRQGLLAQAKPPARAGRVQARDPLSMNLVEFVTRHPVSAQVDGGVRRAAALGVAAAGTPIGRIPDNYVGWCYALHKEIPRFPLRAAQQLVVALSTFLAGHPEPGAPSTARNPGSELPLVPAGRFHRYATDALPPACRRVLEVRTGIQPHRTLRALAAELGTSAEQVRTLEKRARHTLRALGIRYRVRQTLDAVFPSWWRRLCEGGVSYRAARPVRELFESPELYLMEAVEGFEECLAHYCDRVDRGWLLKTDTSDVRVGQARRLEAELAASWALPQPVSRLARRLLATDREIELLLQHSHTLAFEQGYVTASGRRRPTTTLDRVLREAGVPLAVSELRDRMAGRRSSAATQPSSQASSQKATTSVSAAELHATLRSAPQLFLRIWDHQWCSLTDLPEQLRATPYENSGSLQPLSSRETTPETLQRLLRDRGPLLWAELLRAARPASSGTLAAALARTPDVVKCAPGIYGYREGLSHHVAAPPPAFFEERQASALALAKRAELGAGFYPFWTTGNERALCEWARTKATARVYSALVAESEPAAWPDMHHDDLRFWQRERERAQFALGAPAEPGFEGTFPAARLVALLLVAGLQGRISWMEANRCLGVRVNARSGVVAIAVLALLRALVPDRDWRRPQPADRARIDQLLPGLLDPLRRTGHLRWEGLASRIDLSATPSEWLGPRVVARFLQRAIRADG